MQISGQIDIRVPPAKAIEALHDRDNLEQFLLGTSQLTETGPAQYSFVIQRKVHLITLNLPGTLSVTPVNPGSVYTFDARAAHLLSGSVHLQLRMTFAAIDAGTNLAWAGTVESTGLARQFLREKEDRISTVVANLMNELKYRVQKSAQVEASLKQAASRQQ